MRRRAQPSPIACDGGAAGEFVRGPRAVIYNLAVRVRAALLVLTIACGRIGFDSPGSSTSDGADPTGAGPGPGDDGSLGDGGLGSGGLGDGGVPGDGNAPACTKPDIGCAADEYCATPVGMCNGAGTCQALPRPNAMCLDIVVCGCDGVQYGTPCAAARARQSLAAIGACPF